MMNFHMLTKRLSFICLLLLCAFAGMAQTLTTTFNFTASGLIGTPATATTPFQGQTFTNAAITITAVANTANIASCGPQPCYGIPEDSTTVSISGIGTYQLTNIGMNNVAIVDPLKGVTSDIIYFGPYIPALNLVSGMGIISTAISSSTAWNLLTSFGPFQTFINASPSFVTTNGGTLQFTSQGSNGTFQATYSGTPPTPTLTRTGVLSHIAAGGGWTTVITLVNNSSAAVPVTVALHDDYGNALSLPLTTTNQGATQTTNAASVSATIKPNATLLLSAGDGIASTAVGWADVVSSGPVGGFAIFRQTVPNGSSSEGTVPLESQYPSSMTLPYDNTTGFVMGVALANLSMTLANVAVTMWDDSGNQLGTQYLTIGGSGHTSFVLPTQFPLTAGKRGIVQFQSSGGLAGLGLRFSPFGTFTSVPTM